MVSSRSKFRVKCSKNNYFVSLHPWKNILLMRTGFCSWCHNKKRLKTSLYATIGFYDVRQKLSASYGSIITKG